jgi:hypothetical protein
VFGKLINLKKMILDDHNHKWKKHTNAGREAGAGTINATFYCEGCRTELTAGETFQLEGLLAQTETLNHLKGFQKNISVIALFVSALAVSISILTLALN